ncbi:LacI family DNA-binding transcriptional regulator [Roseibium litorale]|uniref:LacI family DNA-binding transcriptional regulator n=1 Tax=Roseibium litorale TaxID=2803841 RepID=A0ABR9CNW9_9HYPH|nr:LacI family DNA-binding transcriptional regulator [Roseibium litorale]MBD8892552.1 LacI family DNA-binding transcriptional regulator [Roseibium litorale]
MAEHISENAPPLPASRSRETVTLADVARAAGVSTMTVSKVLRGTGAISPETQKRIFAAAGSLGYVPNRLAGALSARKSMLGAVLIPSIADAIYSEILSSLHSLLDDASLSLFIAESRMDPQVEERQIHDLLALRPAFLIRSGGIASTAQAQKLIRRMGVAHVQIWDGDDTGGPVSAGPSHIEAGKIAASHFHDLGLRKVAYIGAETGKDLCAGRRMESFAGCMRAKGAETALITDEHLPRQAESGEILTRRLLETYPGIEGIFYLNDAMAIGGLRTLLAAGYRVPDDVKVMGFNGTSREQTIRTRLTTISTDGWKLGQDVANAVLELMAGRSPDQPITCPLTFHRGNTT